MAAGGVRGDRPSRWLAVLAGAMTLAMISASCSGRERTAKPPIEPEGSHAGPTVVLDPRRPEAGSGPSGLKEFPSYVYVPAAGCYFLRTTWPTGSWRIAVAAGR